MPRALLLILPSALMFLTSSVASAAPNHLPIPPSVLKEVANGTGASTAAGKADAKKVDALKEKALTSTDTAEILAAVRELKGLGNVARPQTIAVVREILARDGKAIEAAVAGIGDSKEAATYEKQIEDLRKAARDNIPNLSKEKPETVKRAHELYDKLIPMTATMNQAWSMRMAIIDGTARRKQLLPIWREIAPPGDKQFTTDAETKLKERATKAVGDFLEQTAGLEWATPPKDETLRPIWFFGVCRKIEAWNAPLLAKYLDAEETANFNLVNQYREAIGLQPYEIDPRLVQAARRHSKAMVENNFFAHESPLPGLKTPSDRTKAAGYPGGAGENIASGTSSGQGAFKMWFDSPGHHQNMAGKYAAIGIGRWTNRITQVFGGAPRIMLMAEAERANVKIEGTVVPPADAAATTTNNGNNNPNRTENTGRRRPS